MPTKPLSQTDAYAHPRQAAPLIGALLIGSALSLFAASAARAQQVQFYFSSSPTVYTPVTSQSIGAGRNFTLSVFYSAAGFTSTGNSFNTMDVFVGFDQSNSYGTSATPLDNRLLLAGGNDPTGSAIVTDPTHSGFDFIDPTLDELAGGQPSGQDGTLIRPYGVDILLAQSLGATPQQDTAGPTHLLDLTFQNENLAAGPEQITIYDGGTGTDATTYVDGTQVVRPNSVSFTAMQGATGTVAAPEPGSLVLSSLALLALAPFAGLARRIGGVRGGVGAKNG